ncbi:MAG: carboxylating nicotinate-nucleotide diphosphorylase [bacterium]|nr:carboxylating nicotinate-nucleotide diphosphorylase [bacterium]
MKLDLCIIKPIIERALLEDIGTGDLTTNLMDLKDEISEVKIVVNDEGIIAGLEVAELVFKTVDPQIGFTKKVSDGESVSSSEIVAFITGKVGSVLSSERVALNFLSRLSGIATKTRKFVEKVKPFPVKIVDTRKTTPGLRILERYAVAVGGGYNHRFGLYDGILIKDNHIRIVGGVAEAVKLVKRKATHTLKIEIEVENLEQVKEAVDSGVDIIMLDNMDFPTLNEAVRFIKGNSKAIIEVSGGVSLSNVTQIAETGVDLISIGELTHSAPIVDYSLEII